MLLPVHVGSQHSSASTRENTHSNTPPSLREKTYLVKFSRTVDLLQASIAN